MDPTLQTSNSPQGEDKKKLIFIGGAILVFFLIVTAVILLMGNSNKKATNDLPGQNGTGNGNGNGSGSRFPTGNATKPGGLTPTPFTDNFLFTGKKKTTIKFSESKYSKDTYQIYPLMPEDDKYRQEFAKVSGLVAKTLSDGSTHLDIVPNDPSNRPPDFVMKQGYKLYTHDKDFAELGIVSDLGDNNYILVDAEGYIAAE